MAHFDMPLPIVKIFPLYSTGVLGSKDIFGYCTIASRTL